MAPALLPLRRQLFDYGVLMNRYLLLCAVALGGCQPQPAAAPASGESCDLFASENAEGKTLATIGDQRLTVEAMEKKINGMTPFVRARYQSKERRQEYVEHLMDKALLAQEAIRLNLHKDEKVLDTLQSALAQELSRRTVEERTNFDAIDEVQAKKYYDDHYDDYHKPGAVRISHIYKKFLGKKEVAKKELQKVQAALKAGLKKDRGLFRKQAAEASDDDSTKAIGGDLRYLTEPQLQERFGDALAKAVWNLPKINTMTDIVEGKEGWHIFRLTGRRHAHSQDFKDVKEQIRHRIYRKQRRDTMKSFLEELRAKTEYKLDDAALESIKIAKPKAGKAPPPAGIRPPGAGHFGHSHGKKGHSGQVNGQNGHSHGKKSVTITPGKGVVKPTK
jgi:parvulin-like peptidyl-prolyl isomerase